MSSCDLLTLVLEEDGTLVDSEEFLQSLPGTTQLMVLDRGEMWTQRKVGVLQNKNNQLQCLAPPAGGSTH